MDSENWSKLSLIVATCVCDNPWISFALWVKDNYSRRLVILYVHTVFYPLPLNVQCWSCCFLSLIEETSLNVWQANTFRDEMLNRCSWLQLPLSYSIYWCFPYIYPFKVEMMLRNLQSNSWIHSATGQWQHFPQISLNSSCHSWLISLLQFHSLKLFIYFQSPLLELFLVEIV